MPLKVGGSWKRGGHMASNGSGKRIKNGGSQKGSSNGSGPRTTRR